MTDTATERSSTGNDRFQSALLSVFGLRDISWRQLVWYCLVFSVVGGVIITSFEPLVTAPLPVWVAILHWFFHLFVAAGALILTTVLGVIAGLRMPWPLVAAVILLPFLLATFSMVADIILDVPTLSDDASLSITQLYILELGDIAIPSLGLSALMAVLAYRAANIVQKHQADRLLRQAPEPTLRSVIPAAPHNLGDDLIRVEAQDHYVRLITSDGTATLKLAFSDCVAALARFQGGQCHRSHWVRFKHVKTIKRSGSAYVCTLKDDTQIPVSRRRYSELKRRA
ncbi:LytTR family DNA-binding domain-containing protein [uncultured Roseobacter sp.]|uniref:LytTR family DNA-binding domain-containing protein n=1 Tax=uncultured Roseobacter sp. TaxID=114847 RepID=UPI002629D7B7|nr:LytTR family DNA-binding domain-containing protein [uncultured Roseobacter sp.]